MNNHPALLDRRRELRSNPTPAEAFLWTQLRKSQLQGRKFRRQHSFGPYILDFYCPSERLALELDGAVHAGPSAQQRDHERDRFLKHFGIRVMRFDNWQVFEQTDAVLASISLHFGGKPRHSAESTPRPRGHPC